uniref:Uncharacterized protein n=1 Tax=Rhizophora mucronata TaxID=61149 RepID=A0A2P2PAR9_RHIMU
MLSTDRRNH